MHRRLLLHGLASQNLAYIGQASLVVTHAVLENSARSGQWPLGSCHRLRDSDLDVNAASVFGHYFYAT